MIFKKFDFVKHRKYYFIFSGILIIAGIISLLTMGLNLGVDFKSGTRVQIQIGKTFSEAEVQKNIESIGMKPGNLTTCRE